MKNDTKKLLTKWNNMSRHYLQVYSLSPEIKKLMEQGSYYWNCWFDNWIFYNDTKWK